jgi:two-component system phosphate regulon sensor histidine kinase PhoR
VNRAAGDLLGVETRMEGQVTLANVLRDSDLVELIREPSNLGTSINRLLTIVATAREVHAVVVPLGRQDDQQRLVLLRDLTVLRQTEAVRRDFVANVSHELRTPVSALRAMAETLEGRAADDDETRADFIRRIVVETDRLGQIITELLDLARIESGMSDLDLAVVDLNNIVGVSADRLRPQAMRNDLKLDIGLSPDSLVIWADADRVGRVVMSLIHNAIKQNYSTVRHK